MAFAALGVAIGSSQGTPPPTVMPDVLDYPIIGSAEILTDCGDLGRFGLKPDEAVVCLATPNGCCLDALRDSYGRIALENGWRPGFSESGRVHLQRPGEANRCEQLTLGFARTDPSRGIGDPHDALVLVFRRDLTCAPGAML